MRENFTGLIQVNEKEKMYSGLQEGLEVLSAILICFFIFCLVTGLAIGRYIFFHKKQVPWKGAILGAFTGCIVGLVLLGTILAIFF